MVKVQLAPDNLCLTKSVEPTQRLPGWARKPAPPVFSVDLRPRRCGSGDLLDHHRRGTLRIVATRQARSCHLKDPRPNARHRIAANMSQILSPTTTAVSM